MARQNQSPSWAAITICFIFFWPVGLYLLVKKLTTDKEAAVKKDSKTPVIGWLLIIIGMFFISSYFGSGKIMSSLWAAFFIFGGLSSLSAAKKGNQEGERFRSYINAIVNHGLVSIQDIAAFAGVREKVAIKDLKRMIQMGYFDHAHIDEKRGEIYLYQRHAHVNIGRRHYSEDYSSASRYPDREDADSDRRGRRRSPDADSVNPRDPAGAGPASRSTSGSATGSASGRTDSGRAYDGREGYVADAAGAYGAVEKMTTCRNCGAQNWITQGVRNECEFCGSPLS